MDNKKKNIEVYSRNDFEYVRANSRDSCYIVVIDNLGYFKTQMYNVPTKEEAYNLHCDYIKSYYPNALCTDRIENKYAKVKVSIKKKGYIHIPIEHYGNVEHIIEFVKSKDFLECEDMNIGYIGLDKEDFSVNDQDIYVEDIETITTV